MNYHQYSFKMDYVHTRGYKIVTKSYDALTYQAEIALPLKKRIRKSETNL